MATNIWRGSRALTEADTSPEFTEDSSGQKLTATYSGPHDICLSSRPARGSTLSGWPGLEVTSCIVRRAPGGLGTLTIIAQKTTTDDEGGATSEGSQYEIDWARTDMPLATHNRYKDTLTSKDLSDIEYWIANPTYGKSPAFTDKKLEYYLKRLRGQDSYMLYTPIIRRITPKATMPTTTACGKISTPPINIAGFQYVKTADSARRQDGRWARTEEWTGSYWVDPDLYGPTP